MEGLSVMTRFRAFGRRFWRSLKAWFDRHQMELVLTTLALLAAAVYLWPSIVYSVYPGQAGVLWSRFGGGTVTTHRGERGFQARIHVDQHGEPQALQERGGDWQAGRKYPYSEGLRVKWPWDQIYIYDIRMQHVQHVYDMLAADGLDMKVELSIRWKPIEADLGKLHRDIGPDYVDKLIIPIVGSHARELLGRSLAEELYSTSRLDIQKNILARVKEEMKANFYPEVQRESFVIVEDILIRHIELPELVRTAIHEKNQQKHLADAYVYRLQRERQESLRKRIEARGIQEFQQTIEGSISERYLSWKGIDATLELARSENAKIVVIGAGDDGLPIILGGLNQPPGPSSSTGQGSQGSTGGVVGVGPPQPSQPSPPPPQ